MRDPMAISSRLERLRAEQAEAEASLHMDEDTFRAFYERTARPVWAYLKRMTGDPHLAEDLLQETYYRFLRSDRSYANDAHRYHYLFRIATNLVRDRVRRNRVCVTVSDEDSHGTLTVDGHPDDGIVRRADLRRALDRLKPRDRDLLWLAYAQGSSHQEIADCLGLKRSSIKLMLFRARKRLARLLNGN